MKNTTITIDSRQDAGAPKAVNGVNLGPVENNWSMNFTQEYKRARIPSVRLHDCCLRNLDVADLHAIFPDPSADPDDADNYYFGQTDDYLQAIRDAGAEIYFRLGETIEKQPRKKYICPERWNPERLARVCVNIARHYNDGWAGGFD